MASNLKVAIAVANTALTAIAPSANNGYVDVYATSQPANPETSPGGTALATLQFGATAFPAPSGGVLTANAIAAVTIANSGTALWFRVTQSDHVTPLWDGNVGTAATDMVIAATALQAGAQLNVSSLTFTLPAA